MATKRDGAEIRTLTFYRSDYKERLDALEREAAALEEQAEPRRFGESGEYGRKVAEFEALKKEALADALVVVLQEPTRSEWKELKAKYPPRAEPKDAHDIDVMWGVNVEDVEDDLLYACVIEPHFTTRAAFDEWADGLAPAKFNACARTAFTEFVMAAPDPKSRAALPTLSSGENSE